MLLPSLCAIWMTATLFHLASLPATALESKPIPLCRALERLEPRDQIPVVVSGIYAMDYFYDPEEPECRLNVEPRTCVEFSEGLHRPPEFDSLHRESLRVFATFSGILYGSAFDPQSKNPNIPFPGRLAAVNHRYCANLNPTKLVVSSILGFDQVPVDEPWQGSSPSYGKISSQPYPIEMELPVYPVVARNLRVEGFVILSVQVTSGEVAEVEVQFGDPELVKQAAANVQTWHFSEDVTTTLTVEYEFRLEKRPASEGVNPSLEMRLPSYVLVTGPSKDW